MISNSKILACTLLVILLSVSSAVAQVAEPDADKAQKPTEEWVKLTPQEYIYKWRHIAIEHQELYGIPASITMGQAILESGFGNGYLARVANNHFCIKCKSTWTGATITHADDRPDDCFRVYESGEASFRDHAEFLSEGKRYEFLFAYDDDDYKNWAKGLKKAGYATAPDYAERLIGTIERYNLQLLDGKNGIEAYDKYIAKEYNMNPAELAPKSEADGKSEGDVKASGEKEARKGAKSDAKVQDMTLAYADKGIDPNNFRVTINSHHGYNVYLTNGAHYIIAKEGDTYAKLGELFHINAQTLRKFNDQKGGAEPKAGDVVYVERKLSRWGGSDLFHTVSEGETLHFISQLYGVRLQQLSKLNRVRESAELRVGQQICLR